MIPMPVILIDPGHGSDTPGKRSPDSVKGLKDSRYLLREYEWCREVAAMVCDILQALGYTAFLLVREEYDVSLANRVKRVQSYCDIYGPGNVILVSIHNNAAGDGSRWMTARGWSIFTTKGVTESDRLASHIIDAAERVFMPPLKVRKYASEPKVGRDFEEDFFIIKRTPCTAVLVENFFQDNREDVAYLKTLAGKAACADVIVDGLVSYVKSK